MLRNKRATSELIFFHGRKFFTEENFFLNGLMANKFEGVLQWTEESVVLQKDSKTRKKNLLSFSFFLLLYIHEK